MSSKKTLETIVAISKSASPGPTPAFTAVHVSRALIVIGDEGPIGRIELSRKLGLGEGAVRTIIKHLSSRNFVDPAKEGCVLTQRGMPLYKSLRVKLSEIQPVNARQLALDRASAGVLIKHSDEVVRRGVEQRDAAIRAGATGACTLVYRKGRLVMPMGEREDWTLPSHDLLFEDLRRLFAPREGDVITIVSAPSVGLAEHCAMAAALTLLT
jgi:predicted transcriptional regulator